MNTSRAVVLMAALFCGAFAPRAEATELRLNLGADYWTHGQGVFHLTFAVGAQLARAMTVGGRFGGMVTTSPFVGGVPLDIYLRFAIQRVYFELLGGPWVTFTPAPLRGHVGFGFGMQAGIVSFGLEIGYLQPSPLLGVRLGFRF